MKKEYPDILKLEGEKWHNPDPATGKLGTRVPAEWLQTTEDSLKSLTLEMLEVLKAAGINPNELNNTQVRDAIQKMILARVINYNDIQGRPIVKDSLGDDRNNPASQRVVNDVNRAANNAQTSANIANDKANAAQTRADSAYNLAQNKQDKLEFTGTGSVARMSEVNKKRDITDTVFERYNYPALILRSTLTEKIGRSITIENGSGELFVHYREGDGFGSESGQISFEFPNYSDRLAGLSQTAAIGETQYTQWRKAMTLPSSTDLTSIFYASSITEALRDLPANSLFESLESKGRGISIEHRARYRRIIRTGN